MIESLESHEVFVFGSNLAGNHAGGAARQAKEQFGAEDGIGEGLTGQCYAFPTLDKDFNKREAIELVASRDRFYTTVKSMPQHTFLLTPVGTGIAGYDRDFIERLFAETPENVKKVGW